MEIRPKEVRFGKTVVVYYAFFVLIVLFQLAAFSYTKDIGPSHPFWREPKVREALLKLAVFVVGLPPVLAAFAVFRRTRATRRHWRLVADGVQVFRDGEHRRPSPENWGTSAHVIPPFALRTSEGYRCRVSEAAGKDRSRTGRGM